MLTKIMKLVVAMLRKLGLGGPMLGQHIGVNAKAQQGHTYR